MNNQNKAFKIFLKCQVDKIDRDTSAIKKELKNEIDEKINSTWIKLHAKEFREQWQESSCKKCIYKEDCGWKLFKTCKYFKEEK